MTFMFLSKHNLLWTHENMSFWRKRKREFVSQGSERPVWEMPVHLCGTLLAFLFPDLSGFSHLSLPTIATTVFLHLYFRQLNWLNHFPSYTFQGRQGKQAIAGFSQFILGKRYEGENPFEEYLLNSRKFVNMLLQRPSFISLIFRVLLYGMWQIGSVHWMDDWGEEVSGWIMERISENGVKKEDKEVAQRVWCKKTECCVERERDTSV